MKTAHLGLILISAFLIGCASTSPKGSTNGLIAPTKHDFYLLRTQMLDGNYPKNGGSASTVYVLIQPDSWQPMVFQKFDSWQIESCLSLHAHGSILHFHASAFIDADDLKDPNSLSKRWDAFKAFCQKNDITFVNESDLD
jgi:hypothetical protein